MNLTCASQSFHQPDLVLPVAQVSTLVIKRMCQGHTIRRICTLRHFESLSQKSSPHCFHQGRMAIAQFLSDPSPASHFSHIERPPPPRSKQTSVLRESSFLPISRHLRRFPEVVLSLPGSQGAKGALKRYLWVLSRRTDG